MNHYYGLNFATIPKEVIRFIGELENGDVIENKYKKQLYYDIRFDAFKIVTDDAYDYLDKDDINCTWKKLQ